MADLFKEIIPSMATTKQRLDEIDGYNPYIINQALSNHIDCILYANEMNLASNLPNHMQYDYYFHSIRKGRRPFAFVKKLEEEHLASVKEYFNCSTSKAKEILKVLTPKQLSVVLKILDKGGTSKIDK